MSHCLYHVINIHIYQKACQPLNSGDVNTLSHEAKTKWPPFHSGQFQVHLLEWKLLYFKWNFIEVCSLGCNWQYSSISSVPSHYLKQCLCALLMLICFTQAVSASMILTHSGLNKMVTFSNIFSSIVVLVVTQKHSWLYYHLLERKTHGRQGVNATAANTMAAVALTPCLPWGRFSTLYTTSVLRNDRNYNYTSPEQFSFTKLIVTTYQTYNVIFQNSAWRVHCCCFFCFCFFSSNINQIWIATGIYIFRSLPSEGKVSWSSHPFKFVSMTPDPDL